MGTLHGRQSFPRAGELGRQAYELFEVQGRESLETLRAVGGEMQSNHPMILVVSGAGDQTGGVSPVDEPNRAVMEQQQIVRHLSDGRTTGITMPPDGQEQLVLSGREAGGLWPAARSTARNDEVQFAIRADGHRPRRKGPLRFTTSSCHDVMASTLCTRRRDLQLP